MTKHQQLKEFFQQELEYVLEHWDHTHSRDDVRKSLERAIASVDDYPHGQLFMLVDEVHEDLSGLYDLPDPDFLWDKDGACG